MTAAPFEEEPPGRQSWLPEQSPRHGAGFWLLGSAKESQQHLQGSAKELVTAGKVSVSQFAGDALTVSRGKKAKKKKKPSSVKEQQIKSKGKCVQAEREFGVIVLMEFDSTMPQVMAPSSFQSLNQLAEQSGYDGHLLRWFWTKAIAREVGREFPFFSSFNPVS